MNNLLFIIGAVVYLFIGGMIYKAAEKQFGIKETAVIITWPIAAVVFIISFGKIVMEKLWK